MTELTTTPETAEPENGPSAILENITHEGRPGEHSVRQIVLLAVGCLFLSAGVVFLAMMFASIVAPARRAVVGQQATAASPEVASLLYEANDVVDRLQVRLPGTPQAWAGLALLHSRFGNAEEAVKYWRKCLEEDPQSLEACVSLGELAQAAGDDAAAAEYFARAARIDASAPAIAPAWAQALLNLDKAEEARQVLEDDLRLRPRSVPSLVLLGKIELEQRRFAQARDRFTAALNAAPDSVDAYVGAASATAELGDQTRAAEYETKAAELRAQEAPAAEVTDASAMLPPLRADVARIFIAAGRAYLDHGHLESAEQHLTRGLELAPDDVDATLALAQTYERTRRAEEALRLLGDLAQRKSEPSVQLKLGELLAAEERLDEAQQAFRKAMELSPELAAAPAALAELNLRTGQRLDEVQPLAEKAVELEPTPPHYFLLSRAYHLLGDTAAAQTAIEQAIKLDPRNSDYLRWRDSLASRR